MKRLLIGFSLALATIALMPNAAASAPDGDLNFNVSYVNSFVEAHGSFQYWSGPGSGTFVGESTIANEIHDKAKGKHPVGFATITAANGDLLYIDWEQTRNADGRSWVGPYTIAGGTGLFEHASGTGTTTATVNEDGTITQTFVGSIAWLDS